MARILIASELGDGLGHVVPLTAVAERLVQLGHEPIFALRSPASALRFWGSKRFALLAAPFPAGTTRTATDFVTYVDVLWNECGFHDAQRLAAVWAAWRGLVETVAPHLLLVDGAPVALASSRGLPLARIATGNGFPNPPRAPWPSFRTWEAGDAAHVAPRAAATLEHANAAAAQHGQDPFESLDALLATERRVLTTLPELDLYGPRDDVEYVGPVESVRDARAVRWPDGDGPRVLAYLKREHPYRDRQLGALAKLTHARVALYVEGDTPALPPHVAVHTELVDMRRALADCDVVVTAGGSNVCGAALLAGKPLLVTPLHAEQYNNGQCVARAGAGLVVAPPIDKPDYLGALRRLLAEPAFRAAAQVVRERHAALRGGDPAERLAARCDELLRG